MKKLLWVSLFLCLSFLTAGCSAISSDFIDGFSLVFLWNVSPTFRCFATALAFTVVYKWVFKPQFDASDFDGVWIWWGAKSDLVDKPMLCVSGVLNFLLGIIAIYHAFMLIVSLVVS